MNIFITKTMRALILSMAGLAILTLSQGVAKADCVLTVVNNALVITNGTVQSSPITLTTTFAGNALTTTVTQPAPGNTANLSFGSGGAFPNLTQIITNGGGTLSIALASTGAVLSPSTLNLVGTLNASTGLLSFTTTPTTFTYVNQNLNLCATFSVLINPISLAAFSNGSLLTGTVTVVACGTCTPAPVPEPASMLLLGTGLTGLAGAARRRRKQKQLEDTLQGDGPQ